MTSLNILVTNITMKNVIVGKKSANRLVKKKAKHAVVCGSVKTTLFFSNLQHSV